MMELLNAIKINCASCGNIFLFRIIALILMYGPITTVKTT